MDARLRAMQQLLDEIWPGFGNAKSSIEPVSDRIIQEFQKLYDVYKDKFDLNIGSWNRSYEGDRTSRDYFNYITSRTEKLCQEINKTHASDEAEIHVYPTDRGFQLYGTHKYNPRKRYKIRAL